jgi:hypothetical protein
MRAMRTKPKPETPPPPEPPKDYLKSLKEERIKRGIPLIETIHNWEKDL